LRLGAAVCAAEIGEHRELRETYPGLVDAVGVIGSAQVQGRASVGGNSARLARCRGPVPR
jgi:carbon-monoxide dehydrogenase medium subunit